MALACIAPISYGLRSEEVNVDLTFALVLEVHVSHVVVAFFNEVFGAAFQFVELYRRTDDLILMGYTRF